MAGALADELISWRGRQTGGQLSSGMGEGLEFTGGLSVQTGQSAMLMLLLWDKK